MLIKRISLLPVIGILLWIGMSCAPRPLYSADALQTDRPTQPQIRQPVVRSGATQPIPQVIAPAAPLPQQAEAAAGPETTPPRNGTPAPLSTKPADPQTPRRGQFTLNFDDADVYASHPDRFRRDPEGQLRGRSPCQGKGHVPGHRAGSHRPCAAPDGGHPEAQRHRNRGGQRPLPDRSHQRHFEGTFPRQLRPGSGKDPGDRQGAAPGGADPLRPVLRNHQADHPLCVAAMPS